MVDAAVLLQWDDTPPVDVLAAQVSDAAERAGPRPEPDDAPVTTSSAAPTTAEGAATIPVMAPGATSTPDQPTIRPPALQRPVPGRYEIRVVANGSAATGELVVDDDQWQRRTVGTGSTRAQQLTWGPGGAVLAASGGPGADGSCRWDGPAVWVPTDLHDGRRWSSRTTCRAEVGGEPVRVVRQERARVTKRARTDLAGRSLDTWVIDREVALSIEAETFTTTTVSVSTELFAPELGLAVYQTSRTDVPMPDGTTRSHHASEELLGPA